MNEVGIDVSKGRSVVAILRSGGEIVVRPYEVSHTRDGLAQLATRLKDLPGETRVAMEHTGHHFEFIARSLHEAKQFACFEGVFQVKTSNSSAEGFASFCKGSGWATVIGEPTGGRRWRVDTGDNGAAEQQDGHLLSQWNGAQP